jgi:hypothetical protein
MAIIRFSSEEFFELGVRFSGRWSEETLEKTCNATKEERLTDHLYASSKTITEIYRDIQSPDLGEFQIKKPDPVDFLAAFHFLKKHPTKSRQAGFIGCTEKAALVKAWRYLRAFQKLKEKKVSCQ